MKYLKQRLQKMSKEWLVGQLMELSRADEMNTDRILLGLSAAGDEPKACAAKFKKQIDKAAEQIVEHGAGSWNSPLPTGGFDLVADALAEMMYRNQNEIVDTVEYALVKLDSVYELQDECELKYLVDAFTHLHLESCLRLKPEPCALGKRLAELVRAIEWGFFDDILDRYSELLGDKGLVAFEKGCAKSAGKK